MMELIFIFVDDLLFMMEIMQMINNSTRPYSELALYYDYMLRHVNYPLWFEYIKTVMINHVEHPDLIVELGCGTGRFGAKFASDNFTIVGIDRSIDMLQIAKTRSFKKFRLLCADMKNFLLLRKADFIFSVHDTMNYFLDPADLKKVFHNVSDNLNDNGIFMFDITTEYNINKNFNNQGEKFETRGTTIEWNNTYDSQKKLVYSSLEFTRSDGTKISEEHVQRIYSVDEIKGMLIDESYAVIDVLGDYTFTPPTEKAVMINFIARRR